MKLLSTIAVLLVLSISVCAQESSSDCPASKIPNAVGAANSWKRHIMGHVSVCLPVELQPVKLDCYEGGCTLFKSHRFSFSVDFSLAAWQPSSQKYLQSYKEEFTTLDGKPAWIWYFEREAKYRGVSGAKLKVKSKDEYDLGLYFRSVEICCRDLAEKIFRSARLLEIERISSTE